MVAHILYHIKLWTARSRFIITNTHPTSPNHFSNWLCHFWMSFPVKCQLYIDPIKFIHQLSIQSILKIWQQNKFAEKQIYRRRLIVKHFSGKNMNKIPFSLARNTEILFKQFVYRNTWRIWSLKKNYHQMNCYYGEQVFYRSIIFYTKKYKSFEALHSSKMYYLGIRKFTALSTKTNAKTVYGIINPL